MALMIGIQKKSDSVIIAGNGPTRLHFDLNNFKLQVPCDLFACNLAHKNVTPGGLDADLVFAIDQRVYKEIETKCPAVELGYEWRFEPYDMWKREDRPFNNSGSIAIQWAINSGKKHIHLFGFDCLLLDGCTANVFEGNKFYENLITMGENTGRINYLSWLIKQNEDVSFYIYYPQGLRHYILPQDNLSYRYGLHV